MTRNQWHYHFRVFIKSLVPWDDFSIRQLFLQNIVLFWPTPFCLSQPGAFISISSFFLVSQTLISFHSKLTKIIPKTSQPYYSLSSFEFILIIFHINFNNNKHLWKTYYVPDTLRFSLGLLFLSAFLFLAPDIQVLVL